MLSDPCSNAFGTWEVPQTFGIDCTLPFWGRTAFSKDMGKAIAFLNMFRAL